MTGISHDVSAVDPEYQEASSFDTRFQNLIDAGAFDGVRGLNASEFVGDEDSSRNLFRDQYTNEEPMSKRNTPGIGMSHQKKQPPVTKQGYHDEKLADIEAFSSELGEHPLSKVSPAQQSLPTKKKKRRESQPPDVTVGPSEAGSSKPSKEGHRKSKKERSSSQGYK